MGFSSWLGVVGLGLVGLGGLLQIPLLGLLTPEARAARDHGNMRVLWYTRNFVPEGQRILRRGRGIQLLGVLLLVSAVLL